MKPSQPLDLSKVRAKHGLDGLKEVTVTATDLAEMSFCEMRTVLSGLLPDHRPPDELAARRAQGVSEHAKRARQVRAIISADRSGRGQGGG